MALQLVVVMLQSMHLLLQRLSLMTLRLKGRQAVLAEDHMIPKSQRKYRRCPGCNLPPAHLQTVGQPRHRCCIGARFQLTGHIYQLKVHILQRQVENRITNAAYLVRTRRHSDPQPQSGISPTKPCHLVILSLGILVKRLMELLFIISIISFMVLLWTGIAIVRHIHRNQQLDTASQQDSGQFQR
jgi:hypothetical protein